MLYKKSKQIRVKNHARQKSSFEAKPYFAFQSFKLNLCCNVGKSVLVKDFAFFNGRRIYPFNKGLRIYGGGVYHPPFDTLKIGTSTDDIKLKLYR